MFVNLTPHGVTLVLEDGSSREFPASGEVARATEFFESSESIEDVPVFTVEYGEVHGLPGKKEGVFYIVSQLVRESAPERDDLLSPVKLIRDDAGEIIGCRGFARN